MGPVEYQIILSTTAVLVVPIAINLLGVWLIVRHYYRKSQRNKD